MQNETVTAVEKIYLAFSLMATTNELLNSASEIFVCSEYLQTRRMSQKFHVISDEYDVHRLLHLRQSRCSTLNMSAAGSSETSDTCLLTLHVCHVPKTYIISLPFL